MARHNMFRANKKHLQTGLFGISSNLSNAKQKKLSRSEEYHFYEMIFCNIREEDFSTLYSEKSSRPNAAINSMVSALLLKERRGWTYEALFDQIDFNLLTRTALGLNDLETTPFCASTLFYFQNHLTDYWLETGINLLEHVFDHLTESQLKKLKLKTDIQRSDSLLAASNICNYSRLQLLIEVLLRLYRVLSESDQKEYESLFSDYLKRNSSSKYIYSLASEELPSEMEKIGKLYYQLFKCLSAEYKETKIYKIFVRVFGEHFSVIEEKIEVKEREELHSGCVQSPDDIEATYRKKRDKKTKGYAVTATETANPDNPINLITDVAVTPNNKDDSEILNDRIDKIKEKTPDLNELHTDGAYGSEDNDKKMEKLGITHIQTAIRGRNTKVPIIIEQKSYEEYEVSCPSQTVKSDQTRTRYKACFDLAICSNCPLAKDCRTIEQNKCHVFYFTYSDYLANKRQRNIYDIPRERRTLRNNVEACMNEFQVHTKNGKLKVRGLFKTSLFAYERAITINFGRIYRYAMQNHENYEKVFVQFYFLSIFCFIIKRFLNKYQKSVGYLLAS